MALILSGSINAGGSATKPQFVGSASYATTASFSLNAGGIDTGSLVTTSSFDTYTGSSASQFAGTSSFASTASYVETAQTASFVETAQTASYVETAQTASFVETAQTASYVETAQTASYAETAQTASYVETSQTASNTPNAIINAETSSVNQANSLLFTKGDGSTISLTQDTSSYVKFVNSAAPDATGNVSVSITSVETGTSASMLAASSSGLLDEGDVWVVSGESGSLSGSNGEAYIYSSVNTLLSISPSQQGINDQRYVFKFGDTMTGQLILNADPTNVLGAATKQYVDPAFTGSYITSASNGEQTIHFVTKGGGNESHSWVSSSYAVTSSYAIQSTQSDRVSEVVKNNTGVTMGIGTPVHFSGQDGGATEVIVADASDPTKMPCHGILEQALNNGETGNAVVVGEIEGNTSAFSIGDTLFVAVGGGLTTTKPTGEGNLIQNLGVVKLIGNPGKAEIFGAGRSNDVPNIQSGSAWVGNSDGVAVQVPTSSFFVATASFALNSAGGNIQTPVITGSLSQSVDQGSDVSWTLNVESGNPAMWAINNTGYLTGSLETTSNISVSNTVLSQTLNETGSFTTEVYALTALGRSEATEVGVTVLPFTITSSNVFGNDLSKYYIKVQSDSTTPPAGNWVYWGNGVVNNSSNTLDVENSTGISGIDTRDYAIWYNADSTGDKLIGVEYTSGGTLDSLVSFNVADYTNTTTNQTATGLSTVTSNEKLGGKLFGKYVGTGYYQMSTPSSDFYLEISGSGGLFNSFGTKTNGDWMFGFNLLDDWTIGNTGLQMLAPSGSANGAFVFAPGAYFITTSDTDFYTYGDHDTQADSTSGISWAPTDGVMAPSGSSIIVYFDDSTDTTYLYVDGTQEVNSTSVDTYMISSTTTDPILNFGNPANRGENDYSSERAVINFPYRINNLWVANTGTSLGSSDITELASHSDISDSTNYASIDFHSQEINETPDKGTAVLSRKSFTRPS